MVHTRRQESPQASIPGLTGVADADVPAAGRNLNSRPAADAPSGFGSPPTPKNRTIRVDTALALAIGRNGEKLTMLVSHLDWLLKREGFGVDHDGHHWVWKTHDELRTEIFMDGISLRQVKRIVDRGRETGVIVTFNPRNHKPLHYRIDYVVIRQLFESVSVEPPAWVRSPPTTGIQLDQFAEADIREVLEGPPVQPIERSDIYVTSLADRGKSQHINIGEPSDMDVTSLYTDKVIQTSHTEKALASRTNQQFSQIDDIPSHGCPSASDFIAELATRLGMSASARELNTVKNIEQERSVERNGYMIAPGWALDIERTLQKNWRSIDRPVGAAVYELRDLIERETAGELDLSEQPDWIPRPPTQEEIAAAEAAHEEAMALLIRRQQEREEQEVRERREREAAEATAEAERIERERKEAEAAAEAERIERERKEGEAARERYAQLRRLADRLEHAPERRSKLAMHFEVSEDDVTAWESALDLVQREIGPDRLLRHPELVEVFEAMGLGLTDGGVYRLAFATNLKQQVLLRQPSAGVVSGFVRAILERVGIDAQEVRPVIPRRLDWERQLGQKDAGG